ncbi:MAG: hypothetical protein ABIH23_24380 [bacterium]
MAQIVTLPRAPQTALSNLGSALFSGVSDAADRRLRENEIARLRQERLADIESERGYKQELTADERGYNEQVFNRMRELQLGDEQRKMREAEIKEAIGLGLLSIEEAEDPAKVQTALQLMRTYRNEAFEFSRGLPGQAKVEADQLHVDNARLLAEDMRIAEKETQLDAILSEPEPKITQDQVDALAVELAMIQNGGKQPKPDEIAAMKADAGKQLFNEAYARKEQRMAAAIQQRQILSNQRANIRAARGDIRAQLNTIMSRHGVSGARPTQEPPPIVAPRSGGANLGILTQDPGFVGKTDPSFDAAAEATRLLVGNSQTIPTHPEPEAPAAAAAPSRWDLGMIGGAAATKPPPVPEDRFAAMVTEPGSVDVRNLRNRQSLADLSKRIGPAIGNAAITTGRALGNIGGAALDVGTGALLFNRGEPFFPRYEHTGVPVDTQIARLEERLAAITQPGTPLEANIRRELDRLRRSSDQQGTRMGRILSDPISNETGVTPPAARKMAPVFAFSM